MDRRSFLLQAVPQPRATQRGIIGAGTRRSITSTLAPWSPGSGEWSVHTAGHLFRRAGFGGTYAEIQQALGKTPAQVVDALLDDSLTAAPNLPSPPGHSDQWLNVPPYLGADRSLQQQQQTSYSYAANAIRRHWALQMAQPKVMLREKMVYFWANHFVVEAQKVYYPQLLYNYLDYFRTHPWGNFKQMVKDVTILPAMLIYLDGASSIRTQPNENYARELMELFTLGVTDKDGNPNYSETDIHEVAKALTGYTIDPTAPAPSVLPTVFNVNWHDATFKQPFADAGAPKKQYGLSTTLRSFPDDIIDALFEFKGDKLAWFICSKLYQYFVYHDISGDAERAIIDQMAQTFKAANWELKPVLAQLLKSEHFFDEANIGAAIKSPMELLVSMTRQFDITLDELQTGTMWYFSYQMDQSLLDPPNVKGWPGYRAWVSTTTLPLRSYSDLYWLSFPYLLVHNGKVPALGSTGYGENNSPVQWGSATDSDVLLWGRHFPAISDDVNTFIAQVATFLCATPPSADLQQSFIRAPLQFQDYEWVGLPDTKRAQAVRTIVEKILSLPEYQLQ